LQPELAHPGAVAAPAPARGSSWQTFDRIASYVFAALILGGGMFVPLGLAIYSLFFRSIE